MEGLTVKPLTLEEVCQAYDSSERIGLHVLLRIDNVMGINGVIDHRDDDGICAVYSADGEWLKEKDYGKRWFVYGVEQPRLDRLAWEPCEACKAEGIKINIPAFKAMAVSNQHLDHGPLSYTIHFPFCPMCGRPLTDTAWDALEKRLGGKI